VELPDFTGFEPFNALRERMGAERLGYFELFDPEIHLTGSERSQLENDGLLLQTDAIRLLPDKTLAVKNSRVLAYNPDENWYRLRREYPSYHVAFCSEMAALAREQPEQEWLVTTRLSHDYRLLKIRSSGEVSVSEHGFVVCKHCLHLLRYRDFDLYRNRRRGYSEKVLNSFSLGDFYRLYLQYPLSFNAQRAVDSSD
jgi:hypothetical protein